MQSRLLCLALLGCACSSSPDPMVGPVHQDAGPVPTELVVTVVPDAGPACVATGGFCNAGATCCAGHCASNVYSYTPENGRCAPPVPDGSYCEEASWCASGFCTDGICGAPSCVATGAVCTPGSSTCCAGHCEWTSYVAATCVGLLSPGEACGYNEQCSTHACLDYLCREVECVATAETCYQDGACCTGFCTYDGLTYAPGHCAPRQPTGTACTSSSACVTFNCVDGRCL